MLIRITGGVSGQKLKEYLATGEKKGREQTRDELDERVILVGDLELTAYLIDSLDTEGERFLHVTLAFKEDKIDVEIMKVITEEFRQFAFAAYGGDEFNMYAEAHIPKVKSYTSIENGEFIERKPHIHIAIPKINLVSGGGLNPFGMVEKNKAFIDAFQEHINAKYGLASPKNNRRTEFTEDSEIISRYQGAIFSGQNNVSHRKNLKSIILGELLHREIETIEGFRNLLVEFGETKSRNAGKPDEYENLKPLGCAKGINLKDYVFSRLFIELPAAEKRAAIASRAEIKYESASASKPSTDEQTEKIAEWMTVHAREIRFINSGNKKLYHAYREANAEGKQCMLADREALFDRKFRNPTTDSAGRAEVVLKGVLHGSDHQLHIAKIGSLSTSRSIRSLRGLSSGDLVRDAERCDLHLPVNAFEVVADAVTTQHHRGRRPDQSVGSGSRSKNNAGAEQRPRPVNPSTGRRSDSAIGQQARDFREESISAQQALDVAQIKLKMDASQLLVALSKSHGLIIEKYSVTKSKDGSDRVTCGTRNLNVSDFLTKEMNLSWVDARKILHSEYALQIAGSKHMTTSTTQRQPRQDFWKEFAATGQPKEIRIAEWAEQKQSEKTRRVWIKEKFYAQKAVLYGNPSAGKRAALSLLRMEKLKNEAILRDQIVRERDVMKEKFNRPARERYRDWLHDQAQNGRESCLEELRRMRVEPYEAQKPGDAQIKGVSQKAPLFHSLDFVVHNNGDVTYFCGREAVLRDSAWSVNVLKPDHDTIEAALRLAVSKFGSKLELSGSDEFKASAARIAAQAGLHVDFDDPSLNRIFSDERKIIESARAIRTTEIRSRVNLVEHSDGPAIDQWRGSVLDSDDLRKERITEKIAKENTSHPQDKPKPIRIK